jgi:LysM repeat protein
MRSSRDFGNALIVAFISIGLIVGALSISLVEFSPQATPTPTNIIFPSPQPETATPTLPPTLIPTIGIDSSTPISIEAAIFTSTPPLSCQPPAGWITQIKVLAGDTLDRIAIVYRISKDELRRGNCLVGDTLVPDSKLYIPPVSANTPAVCNSGASGWVKSYVIKPGDTMYAIATNHYTTSGLLKSVNCRSSDLIIPGEIIWVPNVATRTPYPTPMPGATITTYPTDPLTVTALPFTATIMPMSTLPPTTPTAIPTFTASATPIQ